MFEDPSGTIPIRKHLYQNALADFVQAYKVLQSENKFVSSVYVIWYQGETDAIMGTTKAQYSAGLNSLIQQMNQNFSTQTGRKIDGFAIGNIGYFFNWGSQSSPPDHRERIHKILDGIESLQSPLNTTTTSPIFVAANAALEFMSPCITGAATPGCESTDLIHYATNGYEKIGQQLAININRFQNYKKLPLSSALCDFPDACGPAIPVYQWRMSSGKKLYSSNSREFDASASSGVTFAGIKVHLYHPDIRDNRFVQIFRSYRNDALPGLDSYIYGTLQSLPGEFYPLLTPLGTCFKSAAPGYSRPIRLPTQSGSEETLCFVDNH